MCQVPPLCKNFHCVESRALDFCSGGIWNKTSRERHGDCSIQSPWGLFSFVPFNPGWAPHGFPGGDLGLLSHYLLAAELNFPGLSIQTVIGTVTGVPVSVTLASLGFILFLTMNGRY